MEYNQKVNADGSRDLKRKDLCREKKLFRWDEGREFLKVDNVSRESKASTELERLRRAIQRYRNRTLDNKVRSSCDVILTALEDTTIARHTPDNQRSQIEQLRLAIATRTPWKLDECFKEADRILQLIELGEIW